MGLNAPAPSGDLTDFLLPNIQDIRFEISVDGLKPKTGGKTTGN